MEWFPLRANIFHKRKTADLPPVEFKAWILFLCIATEAERSGIIGDIDDIVFAMRPISDFGVDIGGEEVAQSIVDRLVDRILIDRRKGGNRGVHYAIHDWADWQLKSITSEDKRKPNRAAQTILDYNDTKSKPRLDARTRAQGEDSDDKIREERSPKRSIAEQTEPPVRPILDHDEETEPEKSSAPPPPPQPQNIAARQRFEKAWEIYWGIPGNPGSSKMRAWEVYKQLSEEDQADANVGVIMWRLDLNGKDAGFAKPDPARKTKIKFLENWLGDEQWKQFDIPDNPNLRSLAG